MENLTQLEQLYRPLFEAHNTQLTKKKLLVLYKMVLIDDYTDAESLFLLIRQRYHISYSSVYNTLKQLRYIGLVIVRTDNQSNKQEFKTVKYERVNKTQTIC